MDILTYPQPIEPHFSWTNTSMQINLLLGSQPLLLKSQTMISSDDGHRNHRGPELWPEVGPLVVEIQAVRHVLQPVAEPIWGGN
jgi:hypothetical protein